MSNLPENICCAGCDDHYLHQIGFIWYQRSEDDETGTAFFVEFGNSGNYTFQNNGSGNPSLRRHGSILVFRCELCSDFTGISFAQHKGMTMLDSFVIGDGMIEKKVNLRCDKADDGFSGIGG